MKNRTIAGTCLPWMARVERHPQSPVPDAMRTIAPDRIYFDGVTWSVNRSLFLVDGKLQEGPFDQERFEAYVSTCGFDLTTDAGAWSLMYAWEILCDSELVCDARKLEQLSMNDVPLNAAAQEAWRAPHFDDDELVFFGNGRKVFTEVRVHTTFGFVEVCEVAPAAEHLTLGRALVDGGELAQLASDPTDLWALRAADEAAAVLAFQRARAELQQLGAPDELLSRYRRAAQDEARHARICLRRARSKLKKVGPGARVPPRRLNHKEVALAALFEAAIPESLAVERLATEALDDDVRSILDDERTHVLLAWDTIAWAAQTEGVAEAVWRAAPKIADVRARARAILASSSRVKSARPPRRARVGPHRAPPFVRRRAADN